MKLKMVKLSFNIIKKYLTNLIKLDVDMMAEKWETDHFLIELPLKWQLSYLCFINNNPVGYAIASVKNNRIHLHRIAVARELRSLGIGKKLIEKIGENAIKLGLNEMTLKVSNLNIKAQRFYFNLGFGIENEDSENIKLIAEINSILKKIKTDV